MLRLIVPEVTAVPITTATAAVVAVEIVPEAARDGAVTPVESVIVTVPDDPHAFPDETTPNTVMLNVVAVTHVAVGYATVIWEDVLAIAIDTEPAPNETVSPLATENNTAGTN